MIALIRRVAVEFPDTKRTVSFPPLSAWYSAYFVHPVGCPSKLHTKTGRLAN